MAKFNNPKKCNKIVSMHKIGDAQLQCVNNHFAKFELKGIRTGLHKLGTPKSVADGRTDGRTYGVDQVLALLSLKRRRSNRCLDT